MENYEASMATRIKTAFKKYDMAMFDNIVRRRELREFNAIAAAIGYEYKHDFIEAIRAFRREIKSTFKHLPVYQEPYTLGDEEINQIVLLELEAEQIGIGKFIDKYCPPHWNKHSFRRLCRQVFSHLIAEGKFKFCMSTGNDIANSVRWGEKVVLTKEQAQCLPRSTMFRAIKKGISHKTWEKYQKAS